jgi:hypothetical protein
MRPISEAAIQSEALSIWEASGRPIWSHPLDYWCKAIERLGSRADPVDPLDAMPLADAPLRTGAEPRVR